MENSPLLKQISDLIMPEIMATDPDRSAAVVADLVTGLALAIVFSSRGNRDLINCLSEGAIHCLMEMTVKMSADLEKIKSRNAAGQG